MASLVRISFTRFINGASNTSLTYIGVRNISGKTMRVKEPTPKPAPWPYKTKRYTIFHSLFDKTTSRLDENSKLLVVEGPVAAGKTKFAQELADELEMAYFPEANLDMIYTNEYGYDMKRLDDQLPESCRSFDVNNFLLNPKHRQTATFQLKQYGVKYSQYIDALAHILSTGQGVILDRCVYSDFVFLEAMYNKGYISREARSAYYDVRKNSIYELLKPHLIIYLDVPVSKIVQNIQERKITYEQNSPVLTPDYLSLMERYYKQHYLKEMSTNTELLVYDWSHGGEVEVIVEDIERVNFSRDKQDPKFSDWVHYKEEDWAILRNKYADKKDFLMTYLNVPRFDVPELVIEAEDVKAARDILNEAPGNAYMSGYNTSVGDGSTFLKVGVPLRETLPLTERRIH